MCVLCFGWRLMRARARKYREMGRHAEPDARREMATHATHAVFLLGAAFAILLWMEMRRALRAQQSTALSMSKSGVGQNSSRPAVCH